MFDNEAISAHFGRAAEHYEQHAKLQKNVLLAGIEKAAPHWLPGTTILDVGSGTGMFASEANKQEMDWNITGCDLALGMCKYAASKGYISVNADAHNIPFADNSFDGVFSSLMLQWANDPVKALTEMARVMKPGGYGLITSFSHGTLFELEQAFLAVDSYAHTSEFGGMNHYGSWVRAAGFVLKQLSIQNMTEHYPTAQAVMQALKAIGATHKNNNRKRGLMSRRQLLALEQEYKTRFVDKEGLPVTWKVITLLVHKT